MIVSGWKTSSGVSVQPNPPVEGQPVTITVTGPGPFYVSRDPDGDLTRYDADAQGEIELTTPPGAAGQSFTVSNYADPPVDGRFTIAPPGS
jgi:hypothetical protein